jgi:cell division protein FtsI (penicillin-binding protein 3)
MPKIRKTPRFIRLADAGKRLRVSFVGVCVVLSLFGGRLVQLQGLDASSYAAVANTIGLKPLIIHASRGEILDRHGATLANTVEAYNVTVDQTQVTNPAAYALQLEQLLGVDAATLQQRLTGTDRFVYVAKGLPGATWRQVKALRLAGIYPENASAREYPAGAVAGNIIGVLGSDGQGLTGLEQSMNAVLAGKDGRTTYQYSPGGQRIPTSTANSVRNPVPGTGLRLTIDRDVQWYAQQALADAVDAAAAADGVAVVMTADTQQIVAMAATPGFDPNEPAHTRADARGSKAVEEAYEPGSVFKPLTMSALIEQGAADPTSVFSVPDHIPRSGEVIHDYYNHPEQRMTLAGILAKSSNVGTVLASEQLDKGTFRTYLARFGLGAAPGLGLPAETGGDLPKEWSDLTRDTIAFGQGVSVSAVQLASAYATIANGGLRVEPTIVAATIGPDGDETPSEQGRSTRVISKETAADVTMMMEGVMGPDGTGKRALVPGYRVAGKTGTAQRVDPSCGCYAAYNSSFAGFAPADNPKYVVVVSLFDPKNGNSGGALAGPTFAKIMGFALEQAGVPPSHTQPPHVQLFAE